MRYFSVDRGGAYVEGQSIELMPNDNHQGNEVLAHINKMYPAGFSRHGAQYFRDNWLSRSQGDTNSGVLELLLEATRKAYYPEKPSRYQSVFACESLTAAERFRFRYAAANHPIYELHPSTPGHRGDMAVYRLNVTFACIDHRLHLYWQGETLDIEGHEPQWEYVLSLPVRVGERVA